jgi:hypothetical protein
MAGKVLLGLLVAAGVTGSAVYYSNSPSYTCPLSGACTASAPVEPVSCCSDDESAASPACSASRAKAACGMDGECQSAGGDALAALSGGACLGR